MNFYEHKGPAPVSGASEAKNVNFTPTLLNYSAGQPGLLVVLSVAKLRPDQYPSEGVTDLVTTASWKPSQDTLKVIDGLQGQLSFVLPEALYSVKSSLMANLGIGVEPGQRLEDIKTTQKQGGETSIVVSGAELKKTMTFLLDFNTRVIENSTTPKAYQGVMLNMKMTQPELSLTQFDQLETRLGRIMQPPTEEQSKREGEFPTIQKTYTSEIDQLLSGRPTSIMNTPLRLNQEHEVVQHQQIKLRPETPHDLIAHWQVVEHPVEANNRIENKEIRNPLSISGIEAGKLYQAVEAHYTVGGDGQKPHFIAVNKHITGEQLIEQIKRPHHNIATLYIDVQPQVWPAQRVKLAFEQHYEVTKLEDLTGRRYSVEAIRNQVLDKLPVSADGYIKNELARQVVSLLNGRKTDVLMLNDGSVAKLAIISSATGYPQLTELNVVAKLQVQDSYMGHKFTPTDRQNLERYGNMGRLVPLTIKATGETFPGYIGVDKDTKRLLIVKQSALRIGPTLKGVTLSSEQISQLASGKQTRINGMIGKEDKPFDAFVRVHAGENAFKFTRVQPRQSLRVKSGPTPGQAADSKLTTPLLSPVAAAKQGQKTNPKGMTTAPAGAKEGQQQGTAKQASLQKRLPKAETTKPKVARPSMR